MSIKSKEISKYYIKQLILSDDNNPDNWNESDFNIICEYDNCIGYLFSVKEGVKFAPPARILNLYLIKQEYFPNKLVTIEEIKEKYDLFVYKCNTEIHHSRLNVFRNPPIEQWIDTKENWCKKLAGKISKQFKWTFEEALSEVYLTIMKCYYKPHVYMGNLGYIQKSVYNNVLLQLRYNRIRVNQDSKLCLSLDAEYENDDGDTVTLKELLGKDEEGYKEIEYQDFEKDVKELLLNSFSEREIEQIFNVRAGYLPMNLYRRLIKWRGKHKPSELYKEEKNNEM